MGSNSARIFRVTVSERTKTLASISKSLPQICLPINGKIPQFADSD